MTTILIIAIAVNILMFLFMVYSERKRAKRHRDKILEMKGTEEVYTTQMVRLSEQVRNANNKLGELQKEYDTYKKNVETNELMSIPNTQDLRVYYADMAEDIQSKVLDLVGSEIEKVMATEKGQRMF